LPIGSKNRNSQVSMLLSVIIVNYNVKHFLEQCLCSLQLAIKEMEAEVIVVDNDSTDGSMAYLQPRFPTVKFIANRDNTGFARANNQAFQVAKGKYILFLNPDTLVPDNCLVACMDYLDNHKDVGALGTKMLDGSGCFLPESKRAFPSPLTSLFKLLGLSALFPKSKLFGKYHLGNLSHDANHEVDVLAGAFMMIRKEVLDSVGAFDEAFFMYGEDVDLSYRIQKAGWKNVYFAESTIIHFKGESTKKGSLNYVRMFYQAMHLFVKKHYGSGSAGIFRFFIQLAIWLRAAVTALGNFLKWLGLPLMDTLITLGCLAAVAKFWQAFIKPAIEYRSEVMYLYLPLFTLSFILSGAVTGLYDQSYKPRKAWIAMMIAVLVNLAIYSLLDIDYRFSRGVMLFGGLFASICILLFRKILVDTNVIAVQDEDREYRQTLVAGSEEEYQKVITMMHQANRNERVLGRISLQSNENNSLASFNELGYLLKELPAREIVFCIGKQLTLQRAMLFMKQENGKLRYKFYYAGSNSIVGSDSKGTTGEAVGTMESFELADPANKRMKRVSDIAWSLLLFSLLPLNIFIVKKPIGLFRNIVSVLIGKRTWVGYCSNGIGLPPLKEAVICCNAHPAAVPQILPAESLATIDYWYAKDYEWLDDSRIIRKAYNNLGEGY
jgi:GT2 family glycosyltransferase